MSTGLAEPKVNARREANKGRPSHRLSGQRSSRPLREVRVTAYEGGRIHELFIPSPSSSVVPGVTWGRFDTMFTPAFWRTQVWFSEFAICQRSELSVRGQEPLGVSPTFALGLTLAEELAACLLGGYGIPAEIGLAAFNRVRCEQLLGRPRPTVAELQWRLQEVLSSPLCVAERPVHYRFATQRTRYLAASLHALDKLDLSCKSAREFRNLLLSLPGIGFKTASWITRNHLNSDQVAILDVHIVRAGRLAGCFPRAASVQRDYLILEHLFLEFAAALGVSAAVLDAVMWQQMRSASRFARAAVADHVIRACEKRPPALSIGAPNNSLQRRKACPDQAAAAEEEKNQM
jgi:N-glycosylase/DNA lyase